jgi:hypothetical protein
VQKVIVIPISLIWRVQIKPQQKFGLAAFLCLSIVMIIVAIVRSLGLRYHNTFDYTWLAMWQQIESCVAVTMLSLTAFRSIFVSTKPSSDKARPWVPSTHRLFRKFKKPTTSDAKGLDDVTIPSATITGLTRVMGRTKANHSTVETLNSDSQTLTPETYYEPSSKV